MKRYFDNRLIFTTNKNFYTHRRRVYFYVTWIILRRNAFVRHYIELTPISNTVPISPKIHMYLSQVTNRYIFEEGHIFLKVNMHWHMLILFNKVTDRLLKIRQHSHPAKGCSKKFLVDLLHSYCLGRDRSIQAFIHLEIFYYIAIIIAPFRVKFL